MKSFEILPHTADMRLKVKGDNLSELLCRRIFRNGGDIKKSACAILGPNHGNHNIEREISLSAPESAILLVDFLSEVLTISCEEKTVFCVESEISLLYDVAHNLAKIEEYGGQKFIVHRKGATRASPGQPVLIPGSMGTASYVLPGTEGAMKKSFGSTCHGAGRRMSRHAALRQERGRDVRKDLIQKGIMVESGSWKGLDEEAPFAYKNFDDVVGVVAGAGIAQKVPRLRPMAVIKG